jgi:hypothetical protein
MRISPIIKLSPVAGSRVNITPVPELSLLMKNIYTPYFQIPFLKY